MKIFVSSVMQGFEAFREAAFAAIESLDHDVLRAEDFPASPLSSQIACLQGVRTADLMVLILGERYGWSETASGLAPTHEEFREAIQAGKVIPFVQAGVTREPKQRVFVREVENYDTGLHRGREFQTPEQLRNEVTRAIHRHQLSAASMPVDVDAMLAKATELIPEPDRGYTRSGGPLLHLALVGGPRQAIIRPSELEGPATTDRLVAALSNGSVGYFSYRLRTDPRPAADALTISQENGAAFRLDESGAMVLSVPIERAPGNLNPLIEEHVLAALLKALSFGNEVLELFDPTHKLVRFVLVAGIQASDYVALRSLAEQQASPNSMEVPVQRDERRAVHLNPPDRARMAIKAERQLIAEDLLALLRRQYR